MERPQLQSHFDAPASSVSFTGPAVAGAAGALKAAQQLADVRAGGGDDFEIARITDTKPVSEQVAKAAAVASAQAAASAAGDAFATAIRLTSLVAAGFVGLGLLATLRLPPAGRLETETEPDSSRDDAAIA